MEIEARLNEQLKQYEYFDNKGKKIDTSTINKFSTEYIQYISKKGYLDHSKDNLYLNKEMSEKLERCDALNRALYAENQKMKTTLDEFYKERVDNTKFSKELLLMRSKNTELKQQLLQTITRTQQSNKEQSGKESEITEKYLAKCKEFDELKKLFDTKKYENYQQLKKESLIKQLERQIENIRKS